uniref:Uncharacterized protein n=1 Tax=Arundo donax TaxID=35708 RepID=A0A0A9ALT1_ARUDO
MQRYTPRCILGIKKRQHHAWLIFDHGTVCIIVRNNSRGT